MWMMSGILPKSWDTAEKLLKLILMRSDAVPIYRLLSGVSPAILENRVWNLVS